MTADDKALFDWLCGCIWPAGGHRIIAEAQAAARELFRCAGIKTRVTESRGS